MFFLKNNFIIQFYKIRQFRPHNQCSHTYKVMHCVWLSWRDCFIVGGGAQCETFGLWTRKTRGLQDKGCLPLPNLQEASAPTQPDAVHNLIGMTALVMWPKLPISVKSDDKVTF